MVRHAFTPCPYQSPSSQNPPFQLGYGLGTAYFKGKNSPEFDEKTVNDAVTAIKNGYYHLDGAEAYGNERELGAAIARAGVPRSSLFITTKTSCKPHETITDALNRSLSLLGLDYVDLYLIHHPFHSNTPAQHLAKWSEMEALKDAGKARSIGVSNYLPSHLEPLLSAKHPPVINQIEYHPYLQHGDLVAWHKAHNIAVEAYAPLTAITKVPGGPVDPVYEKLARKYGVEPGLIGLRWCLDQGIVAVTTSGSEQRLQAYQRGLPSFKLTPREAEEISEAGKGMNYRGFWAHRIAKDDWR
ncbi:alpha-keto ester reductase-like protein [Cercophora newfieldiana]|uniref:Alpha-keto ester reductase-like protein n=1 Tax=Cercophora newfieldiana TaxID=92897 RepID=A0AA39YF17_9PEZI|nr:alpha-keto ester reductase-like protein [Cercophora newfieldiana]